MPGNEAEIKPDGRSLGLPDYLVWLGNQLTATAVGAYATVGVGFLEARIIVAMGRTPGLPAAGLGHHLGVDRAAISRALQQLKGAGMIVADEERRLTLTPTGRTAFAEVVKIFNERAARLTAGLGEAELDKLLALVMRLHANVPMLFELNTELAAGNRRPT